MSDLDIKTLRLLVAVADHQNIKHAAAQSNIEPSAISKRIAQLEDQLGTPLLVRGRRGVHPTPAGEALIEHARSVLFTMQRIEADIASFAGGLKGQVRLVASTSAIAESLLDDIAGFMREPENRNIQVDIEERFSTEVLRMVRDGRAALGVCWDNLDFEGLEQRPYRDDELVLAVHRDHPLAGSRALRFEQTLDHEHVGLAPTTAVHRMLAQAAARKGRTIVYRVVVSNFDASFRVVAANLGVSVVPRQVAAPFEQSLGIRLIPLLDAWAHRHFVVCHRRAAVLTPAAARLLDHLVSKAVGAAG